MKAKPTPPLQNAIIECELCTVKPYVRSPEPRGEKKKKWQKIPSVKKTRLDLTFSKKDFIFVFKRSKQMPEDGSRGKIKGAAMNLLYVKKVRRGSLGVRSWSLTKGILQETSVLRDYKSKNNSELF